MRKRWFIGLLGAAALVLIAGSAIAVAAGRNGDGGKQSSLTAALQEAGKPWIGAMIVPTPEGLRVGAVVDGSPAATAGLQRGDIIRAVNGTIVNNLRELREQLQDKRPGTAVSLTVGRNGQTLNVSVILGTVPEGMTDRPKPFPELEGIGKDNLFSHILGGQLNLTDQNGNPVTINITFGTVVSKTDTSVTITPNSGGGDKTYQVTASTLGRQLLSRLEVGANVSIVTVNNSSEARIIGPAGGLGKLLPSFDKMHGPRHHRFGPMMRPDTAPAQ